MYYKTRLAFSAIRLQRLIARFILKKYKIKGELFTKSYEYYMTKPETMKEILDEAQVIIKSKDPKAEAFINKKLKGVSTNANGTAPAMAQ